MFLALRSQQRKWSCNHSHARTNRIYFFLTYLGNVNFSTFGWLMLMYDVYNFGSAICASPYFSNIYKLNSREFFLGGRLGDKPLSTATKMNPMTFHAHVKKTVQCVPEVILDDTSWYECKMKVYCDDENTKKNPEFLFFIWTKFWED